MRRLITLTSLRFLFLPFFGAVAVAVMRQVWWQYLLQFRGNLGLFVIPFIGCPFLVISLITFTSLVSIVIWSAYRTKSLLPTLMLFGGIFLAFQIPLPHRPDTPEKLHFLAYRADYEAVIEMARAGELAPCSRPGSIRNDIFDPPEQYAHVSAESCLEVHLCDSFSVSFFPLEHFYHHIVYTESGEIDCVCGRDPYVEQQIDDHWYVCQYDWN